jgi:hypothetical protein
MSRWNLLKTWLVATAVALLLGVAGPALALDVAIGGRLDVSSPLDLAVKPGCHYFLYRVDLKAGETTVFELRSKEFNAYLILLDGQGRVVAHDDNSGGGTDARIVFTARKTGWYKLMVTTSRAGTAGSYILDISADYD